MTNISFSSRKEDGLIRISVSASDTKLAQEDLCKTCPAKSGTMRPVICSGIDAMGQARMTSSLPDSEIRRRTNCNMP